jgi:formate dehydrogenase major subunit
MYPGQDPATSYNYLPKLDAGQNCSWLVMFDHMLQGKFKGYFAWGQNPAGCGANSGKTREALSKLDWMVVVNVFDNETASFWKGPKVNPAQVKTEVFVLPPAVFCEKEGSISNSGRWIQWRYQGPKPLGDCIPDGDIALELWKKVRDLYKKEGGVFPDPILNFNEKDVADNSKSFPHQFDAHKVAKLMNGYFVTDKKIGDTTYKAGTQVPSFPLLQDDGSTASGNWLHCGSYTEAGNLMARRGKEQTEMQANIGLFPNWSFCWPLNRRIIYNRASCDPQGQPYAPNKAVIKWDGSKWVGDVPDGGWAPSERHPFIMTAEGYARLFGPGLADGPFPEHYEALECPFEEQPFSKQLHNPAALVFAGEEEKRANCDPRYPFVGTSYRVTEHWQSGVMTRWTPWLLEAMPQNFAEIDPELGRLRGIKSGDKVIVENMRGAIECVAIVTPRLQPMTSQGQTLHMVGVLWHFGWVHPKDGGDSANLLTPSVGDPNTNIPETKTFMVNIRKI